MINKQFKHFIKAPLLTLLTLSLSNVSLADSSGHSDEDKVANVVQVMTDAFHKKDMNQIMASYESGAAIMFEPGSAISDPKVIKQMFNGFFQINPKFTYPKGHEVYIANDIAMHIAPWVMAAKGPDGSSIEQTGLSVAILRKQKNGEWLMVLDNPNSQALMNK